ncbi:peptidase S41 [Phyllobacterium ifriqiyense]|uniref:peptidase S41 n=1 Tax=Phyllobacterium ifriqiyense TaxID=314238 RepID=UPI003391115D
MPWTVPIRIVFYLALIFFGAVASARSNGVILTPEQMRADLAFLRDVWAPLDKSFSDKQELEFKRFVDTTMAKTAQLKPEEFALEVSRAVAIARNGHTNANVGSFLGADLPIRTWWFADGLRIVKTHPTFSRLLGARIDVIGKLPAREAFERFKPYLSGTDQRIRFLSPGYLVTPLILKHIGTIDDPSGVALTMQLRNGKTEEITLQPTMSSDPGDERLVGLNRGYSILSPDPADLEGRWSHVLDDITVHSPLYGRRGDIKASFLSAARDVLYIRLDTVASTDETPLEEKFARIIRDTILAERPRHAIVDLRMNNGGDFFKSILFSQALPRLLPSDGRVVVLVGRATFSAGIVTAAMLKGSGGDKVTIIGETMGDNGRFWAEGKKIELPNSKIVIRYGAQFQDYENGCYDISECYWATVAFGPRGISLHPDTIVDPTFDDYAAGEDPVLKAAMEIIGPR